MKVLAKKHKFEVIKYKKEPAWGKPINMTLNTWKGTVGAVKNKEQFTCDVNAMNRHLGISFFFAFCGVNSVLCP